MIVNEPQLKIVCQAQVDAKPDVGCSLTPQSLLLQDLLLLNVELADCTHFLNV